METKLFKLNRGFAAHASPKRLPIYFVGVKLIETARAVFVYGRGTTETTRINACCVCGRALTHPVSVELGIGPKCGKHYWDWDQVGGYTKENIKRLTKVVQEKIVINSWIPKSMIKEEFSSDEIVTVPSDHPMLKKQEQEMKKPNARKAEYRTYKKSGKPLIKVSFPFNHEDLNRVRGLVGREYHKEMKCWSAPICVETIEKLKEWKFEMDPKLLSHLEKSKVDINEMKEIEIPGLKKELYPFQKTGVAFIEKRDGNVLIGDEMGLGKTMQAIAYLQLHPEKRPTVIVVPASLKLNWAKEIKEWMSDGLVQIISGTQTFPLANSIGSYGPGPIYIINYDIVTAWLDRLKNLKPKVLILDECHYFKNNSANRTKAIKKLGKVVPHIIALSGTPIVNRPIEIYNAIQLIDTTIMPRYWDFARRYCGAKHNGFGWDFSGATNTTELHEKLTSTIMIRRLKKDVLKDLPDKTRSFTPIELDNQKEYDFAESDFIQFVTQRKGAEAAERASNAATLAEIEGLKQLAVEGKLKQAIGWIKDFLAVKNKLVVFAVHKFVIDALMKEFGIQALKIDGSVPNHLRQKAVEEFQTNPDIKLFVGNIKAAGVGITLTASSDVAFLELPWTPGEVSQAEDRIHRIGQENSVTIHYLLANNTIEEKIASLLDNKRRILDKVLDGKNTEVESLLSELMNEYESQKLEI